MNYYTPKDLFLISTDGPDHRRGRAGGARRGAGPLPADAQDRGRRRNDDQERLAQAHAGRALPPAAQGPRQGGPQDRRNQGTYIQLEPFLG